jgi:hypothetical protein
MLTEGPNPPLMLTEGPNPPKPPLQLTMGVKGHAAVAQSQLAYELGQGEKAMLHSAICVAEADTASGIKVYAAHLDSKAHSLIVAGSVSSLPPGTLPGPVPTPGVHVELGLARWLASRGVTVAKFGTWPLGCEKCVPRLHEISPGFEHTNPKVSSQQYPQVKNQ